MGMKYMIDAFNYPFNGYYEEHAQAGNVFTFIYHYIRLSLKYAALNITIRR